MRTRIEMFDSEKRLVTMYEKDQLPAAILQRNDIRAQIHDTIVEGGQVVIKGIV